MKKTETFQKYKSKEITSAIEKFLRQTASVVWEVAIFSRQTDFVFDDKTFDEAVHERFSGSNAKTENVKSVVWPRLTERFTGKTLCKGKVLTGV